MAIVTNPFAENKEDGQHYAEESFNINNKHLHKMNLTKTVILTVKKSLA